jgi:hypothetical protein
VPALKNFDGERVRRAYLRSRGNEDGRYLGGSKVFCSLAGSGGLIGFLKVVQLV